MDARSGLESEETVPLIGELARNQVVPVLPVFSGTQLVSIRQIWFEYAAFLPKVVPDEFNYLSPTRKWDTNFGWLFMILLSPSRVIPWAMILVSCAMAAIVCILHDLTGGRMSIPMSEVTIFAVPVGFLLTWRTTVSHGRWWEGIHAWRDIESLTVDMSLQAVEWSKGQLQRDAARRVVRTAAAAVFALRNAVQTQEALSTEDPHTRWASKLLGVSQDVAGNDSILLAVRHVRSAVRDFRLAYPEVPPSIIGAMDSHASGILKAAKSIQILQQEPMPESFVVLLRTILVLYLGIVPFLSVGVLSYVGVVIFQFLISFALMCVEASAEELEHPCDAVDVNDVEVNRIALRVGKALASLEEQVIDN